MKTSKLFIATLAMALFTSCLSGCHIKPSPSDPEVDPKDQPIQPLDHLLDPPSWAVANEDLQSHDEDIFFHQNTVSDVEANYAFDIKMDTDSYESELNSYVRVYDSTRIEYSLHFEPKGDDEYRVTPNNPYELGRYYTIEIKENAPFHLAGKDPDMREFHFNTKYLGGDKEVYNVKSSVHRFLLSDIISKQEIDNPKEDVLRVLATKNPLNLSQGDHFLFWDGKQIDRHAFYGKYHHEIVRSGVNLVYYTSPELGEIFGEDGLDVTYHNYVPTEIYDLVLASENEIKENLENDPALEQFLYDSYLLYEPEKPHMKMDAYDWVMAMRSIQILPEFGFYWPGWSFSISLRLTIPFEYASLTFLWQYYRQSTTSCDAEIKLRECAGVPYWADLAVDISEVIDVSWRFCIVVGDTLPHADDDEQYFKELSDYTNDKAKDFKDSDKKWETIKDSKKDGVDFDGKSLTIRLGRGRFPIGYVFDVFLDFNFVIKLEASVMLSFSYTEHSENNILSYRSGDEDKSSHSVSTLKSSSKSLLLIGTVELDVGLFFRFGIGVCGLEDYISFSINASVGIYIMIGGYGVWSWTNSPTGNTFSGHGGFLFEVGWFASVGIELNLFFVDLSCDFITIRKPFYTTTSTKYFITAPQIEGNKIHLETHEVLVKDLGMLTFETFSAAYMKTQIDSFDPEEEMDYTDDKGNAAYGKVFNFSFKSGKYISYQNGYFIIPDDCPCQFTDTLYIDVPQSLYELKDGVEHFLEVEIEFYDFRARPVYFDGVLQGYYRWGDIVNIPGSPGDKDGYRFYGWQCKEDGLLYGEGEQYVVPVSQETHKKLEFTSDYYKIIYHKVTFYDGLGNIIWTGDVEEGTDAPEPSAADRDKLMPSNAIFVGWSTDFTNVFYDTEVYAIYIYIDTQGGN